MSNRVGRVVALWRYPVKSMGSEPLADAVVGWHGVPGDRRWAFVRPGMERSGFPWLTIRELPEMAHYIPRIDEPGQPDKSAVTVRTPAGAELDVVDPALAAALGDGVRVIKQDRGVFDTFPLSLISPQSIAAIGAPPATLRFRPNLVVDVGAPFAEDGWLGRVLHIGAARVRIDKRDGRCVMVTVDPITLARDPAVLRRIAAERDGCLEREQARRSDAGPDRGRRRGLARRLSASARPTPPGRPAAAIRSGRARRSPGARSRARRRGARDADISE